MFKFDAFQIRFSMQYLGDLGRHSSVISNKVSNVGCVTRGRDL